MLIARIAAAGKVAALTPRGVAAPWMRPSLPTLSKCIAALRKALHQQAQQTGHESICLHVLAHSQEVHAGLPLSLHATAEEQADQQRAEQEQEQQAQLAHSQTNGYAPAAAAAAAANGGGPPHANGYGQPGALTGAGALPAPAPQPLVLSASARAAVRAVERAVTDFGSLKREWVLKVAKAVAQGFFAKASGAC